MREFNFLIISNHIVSQYQIGIRASLSCGFIQVIFVVPKNSIHLLLWGWWIVEFKTCLNVVKNVLKKMLLRIGILHQYMASILMKIVDCANKSWKMRVFLCSNTKGCWFYKREIHCCSIISWGVKSICWFSWGWKILS